MSGLKSAESWKRLRATRALASYGAEAIPSLCAALADPDPRVRTAAAESLRCAGDETCVGPLSDALRMAMAAASARSDQPLLIVAGSISGTIAFIALVRLVTSLLAGGTTPPVHLAEPDPWHLWQALLFVGLAFGAFTGGMAARRRAVLWQTSWFTEAASVALRRIAERHHTLALRQALPVLKAVQRDRLLQLPGTLRAADQAIDAIERVTEESRNLPIAADRDADRSQLPIPGFRSVEHSGTLPITTTEVVCGE